MKVLHLASGDCWGGAESQLWSLVRALRQIDHVFVSVVLLNKGSQLADRLIKSGIEVHEFDERAQSIASLAVALFRHVRSNRPHIIHTHRFKENILGSVVGRILGIPSIRTVHGGPEPEIHEGGCRQWLVTGIDRWVARYFQYCSVAVSMDMAEICKSLLPGSRIEVVPNGIDVSETRYLAQQAGVPLPCCVPNAIRVGFFGRIVPIKRLDLFLRTARELINSDPSLFEFYIAGDGPSMAMMKQLATDLGIARFVHFLGFQVHPLPLLRQMNMVLLTSDHEGLPMIVLEALAVGVPVVSRSVGGIPEVLKDSSCGTLVDSDKPQLLAGALRAQSLHSTASRTPVTVPEQFGIQNAAAKYLDIYRDAAQARGVIASCRRDN